MRVKMFAAVAAVTALGTAAVWAQAQEPRRARRPGPAALQADIGLTDQQVAEIRKIHTQERKAAIRRNADLRIARLELEELLGAATLDEAAIAARVKTVGDLQSAAFKARTETRLAIRRLVTPEQYQKMREHRRDAVRARFARPGRGRMGPGGDPMGPGAGRGGPEGGEELDEADPS